MGSRYEFDVGTWLNIAGIVHIIGVGGFGIAVTAIGTWLQLRRDFDSYRRHQYACSKNALFMLGVTMVCALVVCCVAWTVVGFRMYSDIETTDRDGLSCSNMVLAWCIIQILDTIVVSCCVVCVCPMLRL